MRKPPGIPISEQLEKVLYLKDGDKYDHRDNPDDVTGMCEADHDLRDDLLKRGLVVRWAIDGRYRLTDKGRREKAKRQQEILLSRAQGDVQPFDDPKLDAAAKAAQAAAND